MLRRYNYLSLFLHRGANYETNLPRSVSILAKIRMDQFWRSCRADCHHARVSGRKEKMDQ